MSKYQKILDLFLYRRAIDFTAKPFIIEDKVFAKNGWMMVAIDLDKIDTLDDFDLYRPGKLKSVPYPFEPNRNTTYSLDFLKGCFQGVPQVRVEDDEREFCKECDGHGFVLFKYLDSQKKEHDRHEDCPMCFGRGRVGEEKFKIVDHPDAGCIIGNATFLTDKFKVLLKVAEILGATEVTLVLYLLSSGVIAFNVADAVVFISPCGPVSHTDVIAFTLPI